MKNIIQNTHAAFAALCLAILNTQAYPTGPAFTIQNPCGRDLSATGPQTFLPLAEEVQGSLGALQALNRESQTLMEEYENQNVLTSAEVQMLMSPISNLQGLPSRQSSDYSEIVPQLRQDYNDISVFLVYLQHSQTQQLAYDGSLLETELHNVNQALYTVLCRVDTLLRQQGTTPTQYVDSSVIPSVLKTMTTSKRRYYRDFLLMKGTKAYLEAMTGDYENLFSRVSQQGQ